jgi:hypothetical protein
MEHGIQPASCEQGHLLSIRMQTQFQHTVGSTPISLIDRSGSHWRTRLMGPHTHGLVSFAQLCTDAPQVVANTHKKGNAQRCFVQGTVTATAITIHRRPGLLTGLSRLERALSH